LDWQNGHYCFIKRHFKKIGIAKSKKCHKSEPFIHALHALQYLPCVQQHESDIVEREMNKLDSKIHNCCDYIIGCDYIITMANLNNVIIVFHMFINDSFHISCHLLLETDYLSNF
jgi:hypothetical protein